MLGNRSGTDTDTRELLRPQMSYNGLHPVMCPRTALGSYADRPDIDIDIVINNDHMRRIDLVIRRERSHCLTRVIHIGLRLHQEDVVPPYLPLAEKRMKLCPFDTNIIPLSKKIKCEKAAVVPIICVFVPGVT